jgi:hypothetical protein
METSALVGDHESQRGCVCPRGLREGPPAQHPAEQRRFSARFAAPPPTHKAAHRFQLAGTVIPMGNLGTVREEEERLISFMIFSKVFGCRGIYTGIQKLVFHIEKGHGDFA